MQRCSIDKQTDMSTCLGKSNADTINPNQEVNKHIQTFIHKCPPSLEPHTKLENTSRNETAPFIHVTTYHSLYIASSPLDYRKRAVRFTTPLSVLFTEKSILEGEQKLDLELIPGISFYKSLMYWNNYIYTMTQTLCY